jgi:hypothetical protein
MSPMTSSSSGSSTDLRLCLGSDTGTVSESLRCSPADGPDKCATNMGEIHLMAGDLVSAYRFFLPDAEKGVPSAIAKLVEISERAGDTATAEKWRSRAEAAQPQ